MYICVKKFLAFWEAKKRLKTEKMNIPGHRDWFAPLLNVNLNGRMGISTSEKSVLARGEKLGGASPPPRKLLQREVIANGDLTGSGKSENSPACAISDHRHLTAHGTLFASCPGQSMARTG